MTKIEDTKNTPRLSLDFIAGLICGEGYFGWLTYKNFGRPQKMAVFQLRLHYDDRELVFAVRNSLNLIEPVYEYTHQKRHSAMLIVRKRRWIENIIIPAFNWKVQGLKKKQFEAWKENFYKEKAN